MKIKEMNIEELEQRSLEIAENAKEADKETLESLGAELEEIETRKAELKKEAEERAKATDPHTESGNRGGREKRSDVPIHGSACELRET